MPLDALSRLRAAIQKAQNRWPAGAQGSKGGQFAPGNGSTGGGAHSGGKKPSLFDHLPSFGGKVNDGPPKGAKKGVPVGAPKPGFGKSPLPSFLGGAGFGSKSNGPVSNGWNKPDAYTPPPAPPPGAKPHPKANDKGQPVTINYPSRPSDAATWADPKATATFTPGSATPAAINGVALKPWTDAPATLEGWAKVPGQNPALDADIPFEPLPGKSIGSGVIVEEPDGRIWLTRPTNAFGGYQHTFPKGTIEEGLSLQASAIKEAYEETGLRIEITGVLGDFERTTSKARFFTARRVGGTPAAMGWESQAVKLAPAEALDGLLNMEVDKGIAEEWGWLRTLRKARALVTKAGGKAGGFNEKQARWPAGTPLGGQWKAQGAGGFAAPPKIGSAANPGHQKKAEAMLALAKAGDKAALAKAVDDLTAKVKANQAKGATHSQAKWTAQTHQYGLDLLTTMLKAPKVEAQAARISGLMKLSALTKAGGKPSGSNPGGLYTDAKGGKWLVKGNAQKVAGAVTAAQSDHRARNEVLAAKLIEAAGGGAPKMKLVDLGGQFGGGLGVASGWIDGAAGFNPKNKAHVEAIQKDFALHAWLGNYDVLGMGYDNTVILDGQAVNIDPGGALLFRAQGLPKDAFSGTAPEWETMRNTSPEQKAVFGGMTQSQLQESAARLALIDDDTIKALVGTYGDGLKAPDGVDLATRLINRKAAILVKAGLKVTAAEPAPKVEPKPAPEPPKVEEALVITPGDLGGPPKFTGLGAGKWGAMANEVAVAHGNGDLDALKAIQAKVAIGFSDNALAYKAFLQKAIDDLEGQKANSVADVAAGMATVTGKDGTEWQAKDGVLQPVGQALSAADVKAAMEAKMPGAAPPRAPSPPKANLPAPPDFAAALLPEANTNAPSHNKKVAAIQAAFEAGDEKALLAMGFGSNNYGKKQATIANDALAALGSAHTVDWPQKPGSHPALLGGTGQAPAKAPQVIPNPPPKAASEPAQPVYRIPKPPDFANWNGPGKGLSSKPAVNAQNQQLAEQIKALGEKQDVAALKAMTFPLLDAAGNPTGQVKPISEHPSQHIKSYQKDVIEAATTPYVPPKKMTAEELAAIPDVLKDFSAKIGKAESLLKADEKIGRYAVLAKSLPNPLEGFPPVQISPQAKNMDVKSLYEQSRANYDALSSIERQAIKEYTGGGYASQNNAETGEGSTKASHTIKGLKKAAVPLAPGTVLSRKFSFASNAAVNLQKLIAAEGGVVQDFGIISTSTNPSTWSGAIHLKITTAPGVKGLYVAPKPGGGGGAISEHPGENEIILPYGTRFYVKKVTKGGSVKDATGAWGSHQGSSTLVELIALPDLDEED